MPLDAKIASSIFHSEAAMHVRTSKCTMAKMMQHNEHLEVVQDCPSEFDMIKSPGSG